MPYRSAKYAISTAVKHFRWMPGRIRLKPLEQLRVVAERQMRVEAVDDVQLGQRLVLALPQLVPRLLERHRVGGRIGRPQPRERAEQAARLADVGGLEPQVVVEIGARAVTLLAIAVREPPDRQQVRRLEQAHAVLERQPLASAQFLVDRRSVRPRRYVISRGILQKFYSAILRVNKQGPRLRGPDVTRVCLVLLVPWPCLVPWPTERHRPGDRGSGCEAHAVPPL